MLGLGNSLIHNNRVKRGGAIIPFNTIAPVVSGTNTVGSILTTTNGTWGGSTPITYTYQWLRNGSNIIGATSSTYTSVLADSSANISCRVTATNSVGSANATSNSLTIYEEEYKSILDYATTQGYTLPSTAQRLKQNTLLSSLKTAGVWNKLDTFANFATDGSTQFALIDWKRLTQYTAVLSPTFTTNEGFMGNGTSSYIDTNFNPVTQGVNYTQNNASRYLFMFLASGTGALDGRSTVNINNSLRASSSNQRINQGTTALTGGSFDFTATKGMKSIHRTSSTNVELFNATTQGSRTANSASMTSSNQFILRSGSGYGAHTISFYMNGASMVAENTAIVNAVNTYLNSL
ncbi:hypothetical protein [Flavobacterium sp.]|uniref:hypothetical protein n=1 Tax=Flavobacterium sp. TaxID=239 RepID=UPI00333FDEA2